MAKILDVAMGTKLLLDILNIFVGGVDDINVTLIFLSTFPHYFAFTIGWGGVGLRRVLCVLWLLEMVVAVLCGGR